MVKRNEPPNGITEITYISVEEYLQENLKISRDRRDPEKKLLCDLQDLYCLLRDKEAPKKMLIASLENLKSNLRKRIKDLKNTE